MIRVGFPNPSKSPGKYNYYRSLITAIKAIPNGSIEPVIIMGTDQQDPDLDFPRVNIIRSKLLDSGTTLGTLRRQISRAYGFDLLLEWLCHTHRIQALSHFGFMRPRSKVKTLAWIYDFQHKHLPGYFSEKELNNRDKSFEGICRHADTVIVSSQDSANDLQNFYPNSVAKTRVLHFVGAPNAGVEIPSEELIRFYDIPGKFFALPNQFWVHKNHRVVLEALKILGDQGEVVTVLATGSSNDPRNPNYYDELIADIERYGLKKRFLVLGVIPYDHVLSIIRNSVAVINPSYFEGWSTSVEEAKSLGKRVLLSSLRVHQEQAPARGSFFSPDDPAALARLMAQAWHNYNPAEEIQETARATQQIPTRLVEFGKRYEELVLELVK